MFVFLEEGKKKFFVLFEESFEEFGWLDRRMKMRVSLFFSAVVSKELSQFFALVILLLDLYCICMLRMQFCCCSPSSAITALYCGFSAISCWIF